MEEIGTISHKANEDIVFQVGPYPTKNSRIWGDVRIFKNSKPQKWGVRLTRDNVENILDKFRALLVQTPTVVDERELYRKEINDQINKKFILIVRLLNDKGTLYLNLRYYYEDIDEFTTGVKIPYENLREAINLFELMIKEWEKPSHNASQDK